jgi:hypothetical protein
MSVEAGDRDGLSIVILTDDSLHRTRRRSGDNQKSPAKDRSWPNWAERPGHGPAVSIKPSSILKDDCSSARRARDAPKATGAGLPVTKRLKGRTSVGR